MMILCGLPSEFLHVQEAFAARSAGLVHDDQRLLHEVVLLNDALDHAGHLVGAAARAGRHDEFHRLGGLPLGLRLIHAGKPDHGGGQCGRNQR